jgi:hypothetical protein
MTDIQIVKSIPETHKSLTTAIRPDEQTWVGDELVNLLDRFLEFYEACEPLLLKISGGYELLVKA